MTDEAVSVSLTREELDLIIGTFDDTEFDEETTEETEDEDGETIEVEKKSEADIAQNVLHKLSEALKALG